MPLTPRQLTPTEFEAMRQAEEYLLGAILIDASDSETERSIINACAFIVKPNDFFGWNPKYGLVQWQPLNARIYSAMLTCPKAPHVVNVARELTEKRLLQPGDLAQFSHCISEVPTHLDWNDYAVAVRYYSQLRLSVATGEAPTSHRITGGVALGPV